MEIFILSALTVGLVQVIKKATGLASRFIPLLAVFIAILLSYMFVYFSGLSMTWELLQLAFMAGLGSVGLWEVGTKTMGK